MTFEDHFSSQPKEYAQFRPHYPKALFDYLAGLCAQHTTAWDCATGNGQAAVMLSNIFKHVIATDGSATQISAAEKRPNIEYRVELAEHSTLKSHSIDLITVAAAYHWFDTTLFELEVNRVLKPNGIIAVWGYSLCQIEAKIDKMILNFRDNVVGKYWPQNRHYVNEKYQTIPFPFQRIEAPTFQIQENWDLKQLLGYLGTWSSVHYFQEEQKTDPLIDLKSELMKVWTNPDAIKQIKWDIFLLIGTVSKYKNDRSGI
jgi:SAM-dependent methyltransferase